MTKLLVCILSLLASVANAQNRLPTEGGCNSIPAAFADQQRAASTALELTCKGVRDQYTVTSGMTDHGTRLQALENANTSTRLANLEQELQQERDQLRAIDKASGLTRKDIRRVWVLLAAVLVFFMQAGFKCLEVGVSRPEHSANMGVMNLSNWLVLCIAFWFSFGLMFGHDLGGIIGTDLFWSGPGHFTAYNDTLRFEFYLFQLAFAATAATIVDGALAERMALFPYLVVAGAVGLVIYPIFGHWAWGGAVDGTGAGWLAAKGFKDFAGSTVVHSIGAWTAWVGILFLGPRRYRFGQHSKTLKPFNLGYSVLGVMMLWFGWWGFNGGSLSKFDDPDFIGKVASVILHTNLAGAAAGLTAYAWAVARGRRAVYEKVIGGVLGGLVAITASCDTVHPFGAVLIGIAAGVIHNEGYDLLIRLRHDDVAGAIPVHGFCGVLGTLCSSFTTDKPWLGQLVIQAQGVAAGIIWAGSISAALFWLLESIVGLRVSVRHEDGERIDDEAANPSLA